MRLSILLLLALVSADARANVFDGKATLKGCQFLNVAVPEACKPQIPPDALSLIVPIADRLVKDKQVQEIKDYARGRMLEQLDTSISARKVMLECFDAPAGTSTQADCSVRIDVLRKALEANLRRLRLALAISNIPADINDRSVSPHVQLPSSLGSVPLERLNDEELEFVHGFQKSVVESSERIGVTRLRQRRGLTMTTSQFRARCARSDPDLYEACIEAKNVRIRSFEQFRNSMRKISDSMISDLPLTLLFRKTPITDAELKKQLSFSLKTLEDWRKEAAKKTGEAEDDRLYNETPFVEEYVANHPETCRAAEENILSRGRSNLAWSAARSVRNIALMGTLCTFASPLVCFSVGSVVTVNGVANKLSEWNTIRNRLESADQESPQASLRQAHDKFVDFLVVTALSTVGTARGISGTFLSGGVSLQVMNQLEGQNPFFSDAGSIFKELSTTMFSGARGAVISTAIDNAADIANRDDTSTYEDWLRSDAYTARLYDIFMQDLANNGR